jgi:hypothetical protein
MRGTWREGSFTGDPERYVNPFQTNFLPPAYSPALIYFGQERGWWITCNYPTVLKQEKQQKQEEYNLRYLLAKVRTT